MLVADKSLLRRFTVAIGGRTDQPWNRRVGLEETCYEYRIRFFCKHSILRYRSSARVGVVLESPCL